MSIKDIAKKIKSKDLFMLLVIILGTSAVFCSYKLYSFNDDETVIKITTSSVPVTKTSINKDKELLVASKSGKKYHLPTCSGALRIAEKNKIWFSSREEAENAGYTPAANCKGLE